MPAQTIVREGTLGPDREKSYLHVPFDVPAGSSRIEVEYAYSDRIGSDPRLSGGNTIDLGVFDERGIEPLTAGFRGWSGSERASFFITEDDATPGYLAGPLGAGKWHVLLGLYKIAPQGCTWRVQVRIRTEPGRRPGRLAAPPSGDLPSSRPPAPFAPWLRGELHCHSWHSDGDRSAADVVSLARARGLDFLAVSDHNTIAAQIELARLRDPGLVLIRAVEATTFKGHFCIWGIPDWVDFRVSTAEDMEGAVRFAKERGGLTSCNHPRPFGPPWELPSVTSFECVEVWNGPWAEHNQVSLDFWLRLLESGRRLPAVGGSDWHRQAQMDAPVPRAPGTPTVWVHVPGPPTGSAILDGVRQGHVVLSDEPGGPFLDLRAGRAMAGDAVARSAAASISVRCLRCAGGRLLLLDSRSPFFDSEIREDDEIVTAEIPDSVSLFVRVELRAPDGTLRALSNPLYLSGA